MKRDTNIRTLWYAVPHFLLLFFDLILDAQEKLSKMLVVLQNRDQLLFLLLLTHPHVFNLPLEKNEIDQNWIKSSDVAFSQT